MAYIMYPLTYTMGFETQDCFKMAGLLAHKILTTTMVIKTKSMNLLWEMILSSKKIPV